MTNQQIEKIAGDLVQKFNPQGLAPFPFEKITQEVKDLQIWLVDLQDNLSGAIGFDARSKKFDIFIDQSQPFTRRQFTIAHELGHYFLHPDLIKKEQLHVDDDHSLETIHKTESMLFRRENAIYDRIESEANTFAAALIMPKELVSQGYETFQSIEKLADVFKVSPSAMSIRLERLGLTD